MWKHKISQTLLWMLTAGCMSCQQVRQSIHDTLYGVSKESSNRPAADDDAGQTGSHVETSSSSSTYSSSSGTTVIEFNSPNIGKGMPRRLVTRNSNGDSSVIIINNSGVKVSFSKGTPGEKAADFLYDPVALKAAEKALRMQPELAGKKIYLYKGIHFYGNQVIHVMVQQPDHPGNIDEYRFRDGVWSDPKPVQISARDNLSNRLYPLDDFRFLRVATIYGHCKQKADSIAGATAPDHIYASFEYGHVTWNPRSINGSRERYAISFTDAGDIKSFFRE
ncbi:hypothetical protein [Chitinophaga solisilvae]|uniref:hypothetical protein n=1 Tax=Chitinophaga solisilvae TaxID=1233460 RepID=UPI00136937E5|nr:hypothetical protein [Chitinophaga solisilvae]